jgi:5-methylcytosine-specific restriction endonuclease McrA
MIKQISLIPTKNRILLISWLKENLNEKVVKLEYELGKCKKIMKEQENEIKELKSQAKDYKIDETIDNLVTFIDNKVLGNTNIEQIRAQARKKYKKMSKNMNCMHCKHTGSTQVCHIKAIADFNKLSTVEEINNISNLIGLCPNCHIDLDKHNKFEVTRTATLYNMLIKKSL